MYVQKIKPTFSNSVCVLKNNRTQMHFTITSSSYWIPLTSDHHNQHQFNSSQLLPFASYTLKVDEGIKNNTLCQKKWLSFRFCFCCQFIKNKKCVLREKKYWTSLVEGTQRYMYYAEHDKRTGLRRDGKMAPDVLLNISDELLNKQRRHGKWVSTLTPSPESYSSMFVYVTQDHQFLNIIIEGIF